MNKEKKFYIIIVVLIIALGVCISIDFTRKANKKNNNPDILNIDCNDENCEKETKIKEKDNKKTNDNNKNNSNNNNNTDSQSKVIEGNSSASSSQTGSDNQVSNGTGTENGNGNTSTGESTVENGNGTGTESNNESVNSSESNNTSSENATTTEKEKENFIVSDSYQVWKQHTNLNIFNVTQIAPGDKGSYDFLINNNTSMNVQYNISFDEINEYNVNMLYKLKRNNEYVAGSNTEWVKYNELNLGNKVLNNKSNDSYTIEWKWVDADNDTTIGRTEGANYTLNIAIKASETDEFDVSGSAILNPNTGDDILYYIELALLLAIILVLLIIIKRRQKD